MAKKKYNNKSRFFEDWTTKYLKEQAIIYHDLVYGQNPCYGVRDMIKLDGILNELFKRGIEPKNQLVF